MYKIVFRSKRKTVPQDWVILSATFSWARILKSRACVVGATWKQNKNHGVDKSKFKFPNRWPETNDGGERSAGFARRKCQKSYLERKIALIPLAGDVKRLMKPYISATLMFRLQCLLFSFSLISWRRFYKCLSKNVVCLLKCDAEKLKPLFPVY